MENVTLHTAEIDGKKIAYSSESIFLVQVGLGTKGSYKTRYSFVGNLAEACFYYRCINIGRGYKKRIVCWNFNKPVIAKAQS